MTVGPGVSNDSVHPPWPEQFPVHPMNSVSLCTTDCVRTMLLKERTSNVQAPGQSIPGGLLITFPSLFSVAIDTMTVAPRKLMVKVSGGLATPPTVSEIAVLIDFDPWKESG